jgi:ornithine cyclodeaminase/alanine dehydrogenase-like protein (mu-crystallin family)
MLSIRKAVTVFPRRFAAAGGMVSAAAGSLSRRPVCHLAWAGKLAFIGGGRMTEAMLRCLSKSGSMENVYVYDPNEARTSILKARYGVTIEDSADDAVKGAEFVVSILAR